MIIYPHTAGIIEELAHIVSKCIRIPSRLEIETILRELYNNRDFLKLSIIHWATQYRALNELEFISSFFGLSYDHTCKESSVDNIIYNCAVNPLIYEDVVAAINHLYEKAAKDLLSDIKKVFKSLGYGEPSCISNECIFSKASLKPVFIYLEPWPKSPFISTYRIPPDSHQMIVIQGAPSESILKYMEQSYYKDMLWIFVDRDIAYIAGPTYRHDEHFEIVKAFGKFYRIGFIGYVSPEIEAQLRQLVAAPSIRVAEEVQPKKIDISRYRAKDVLEAIVAAVLEDLGFTVKVDHRIMGRGGTEIEVDVWGEKIAGGSKFIVYASCKNWDRPVEVGVVREEFGRIMQMVMIPHVRILIAPSFTESARREALVDGFIVVEISKKATYDNADEVYDIIYKKLNEVFVGVAPRWLQELAVRVSGIAEELKKISEELSKLSARK